MEVLTSRLDEYTRIILRQRGTVDKYLSELAADEDLSRYIL